MTLRELRCAASSGASAPGLRGWLGGEGGRVGGRGWEALVGTELEFMVFRPPYEEAGRSGYRDLEPANLCNVDSSLGGTARVEPLIRRIRNSMAGAGMRVEDS